MTYVVGMSHDTHMTPQELEEKEERSAQQLRESQEREREMKEHIQLLQSQLQQVNIHYINTYCTVKPGHIIFQNVDKVYLKG